MFLGVITFLAFLVIALLYFIVEIHPVLQDNESWPHYVFLCLGKKVLVSLRSSILLTLAQINPFIEIDDEILNNEKKGDGFGSILALSDKSANESHGNLEEREAQHSDINVVISNSPRTGPQENINEENRQQKKTNSAKKVFKKNSDSRDEEQTILVTQEDAIKGKILYKSQDNSISKQLKKDKDLVTTKQTIQYLEEKMGKQKKELTIVSEWVRLLRKENNALKTKLLQLEGAKKVSDILTDAKERNLEELLEGKSIQVERLQSAVQMLDIENVKLIAENDILWTTEKYLKEEINALEMTLAKIDQKPDTYQSQDTTDWKIKLDSDLLSWKTRIQTSLRKTDSPRCQLKRWTIKLMEPDEHPYANRIQYAPTDYMYKSVRAESEKWLASEENESYNHF